MYSIGRDVKMTRIVNRQGCERRQKQLRRRISFFATFPEKHFGQLVGVLNNTAENRIACLEKRLTSPDQYRCVKPLGFVFNEAVSVTLKV